ncbi:MAG: ABC transporter permease [Bacteroidota bacterium]
MKWWKKNKTADIPVTGMKTFSFRKNAWKEFKKNKPAFISFWMLTIMFFFAFFASFIANDQPLYVKYRGKTFYPAFSQHWLLHSVFGTSTVDSTQNPQTGEWEKLQFDITDWKQLETESIVWAPVPFSPEKSDILNTGFISPSAIHYAKNHEGKIQESDGKFRHRLGTDKLGRDVLAGIIHGTKISLMVGVVSMGIAVIIGLLLGSLAGYYGDHLLTISRASACLFSVGLFFGYFYGFVARSLTLTEAFELSAFYGMLQLLISLFIFFGLPLSFAWTGKFVTKGFFGKKTAVPVDSIISRSIEIFNSMPRLLLIISVSAMIQERSLWLVMVIIGLTSWTEIARFTRAELLKVRELDYITAARALGLNNRNIIFRHALPNSIGPVFVTIVFGIASAILIESGLSFLNIGVPDDTVTWGSMLNMGRVEPEAWWMIVFPGLAIFITITVYNLIGEGLRDALDPRFRK